MYYVWVKKTDDSVCVRIEAAKDMIEARAMAEKMAKEKLNWIGFIRSEIVEKGYYDMFPEDKRM